MRTVNPDDLDHLANLLDGRGGLADKLDEAFTRASRLGVTDKLAPIKPMRAWATETPSDLRRRATIARADGLLERGHRETYTDWLNRVEAHYLAKVPGLDRFGEKNLTDTLQFLSSVSGALHIGARTMFIGSGMVNVLARNSWRDGLLRAAINSGWWARPERSGTVRLLGRGLGLLPKGIPASLSAPGSWLPSQLGSLFGNNRFYQQASRIPFTTARRNALLSEGYDLARRLPGVRSPFVSKAIDLAVGSDNLARTYGGLTHSGQAVTRAGNANLWRVAQNARHFQRTKNALGMGRAVSPLATGIKTAGRTGGFIRGMGIGGSVLATGLSSANVAAQGNPVDAFKEKGAGYVADVAEVGFNASLTAAMVAPNPVTIGLAVGTGLVYGGAKVVEHWDDIKEGTGKAVDWTGDRLSDAGRGIAGGAKSVAKAANPMNWF
ncbi:PE-PGRS family protein [Streptomyces sp. NPDC056568]|uniref:PE-PGRS family protein n=1 Tax=Streptomyces sp. NPDC056568 TaxID=3345866 RepID=UPI0036C69831